MKKVGILYDNISGNVGDQAVGISVREMLAEMGVDYEELVPGRFNPSDYRTIIIGGGYLLQPSPDFFYDKFRVPGKHILNCCGIFGSPDDLQYLNDYLYVTVRSKGDKQKLSCLSREVTVVPCTTMLLKDLPRFDLKIQKPSIGVHLCEGVVDEKAFAEYLSKQPFHIYFLPITHYNRDFTSMGRLSQKVKNSTLLPILRPEEIYTVIGNFDYFICTSLHGAIFAYVHNVPFVLYDSQDKQRFFMEDRKLDSYLFRSFDELKARFEELQNSKPDYSTALANDFKVLQEHKLKIKDIVLKQVITVDAEPIITRRKSQTKNQQAILQERNFQIHYLQNQVETLAAQAKRQAAQISSLETNLQEKVAQINSLKYQIDSLKYQIDSLEYQIHSLEYQMQQIQRSIPMQLVNRYQRVVERLLPRGTRRRYYYELGLTGIRVILNEGWKSFFRKVRLWLILRRAVIKKPRHDLAKFNASISKKEADKLVFPVPSQKPEVSIVIPAYNSWKYTLNCLKSICENTDGNYEVVVIDDASTDATAEVLSKVKNLHLVTNKQNAGFIESCNRGAKASKGNHILFLNNDTMVTKDWLPPLLKVIKREDVGAVGSKLVYPGGTLQEAGGIIWNDGSGWNYGRGDDPDKPEYNYVREVDYCSGASLTVKRELFEKIGGFDERFKPGYYEDADLCFAIRNLGYRVTYQPMSVIAHFEGVSCGTDTSSGIKKYQEINRPKFVGKWSPVLQKHHYPPAAENAFLARDRVPGKRILVIDNYVPTYDKDAGSFDMFSMLKILVELGNKVTFIGDNLLRLEPYTEELQQKGIEVIYAPYVVSVEDYIKKCGRLFDVVILSRAYIAMKYLDRVKRDCIRAKVVYDTVDLNFLRESRRASIENNEKLLKQAEEWKTTELHLARNSDITFVVSPVEKGILLKEDPSLNVEVIIRSVHSVKSPQKQFSERKDILFIGGFAHLPNVDAVVYFVKEIFPLIKQRMPDVRFYIVGSNPPKEVLALQSDAVVVTGYIKDLAPYFENCKVFVAPLRYGAGVKGKILLSMSYGVPVVTTSVGSEGIRLVDEQNVLVADDPQEFVQRVILLYNEEELWSKLSRNSLEHIRRCFSYEMAKEQFNNLIKNL